MLKKKTKFIILAVLMETLLLTTAVFSTSLYWKNLLENRLHTKNVGIKQLEEQLKTERDKNEQKSKKFKDFQRCGMTLEEALDIKEWKEFEINSNYNPQKKYKVKVPSHWCMENSLVKFQTSVEPPETYDIDFDPFIGGLGPESKLTSIDKESQINGIVFSKRIWYSGAFEAGSMHVSFELKDEDGEEFLNVIRFSYPVLYYGEGRQPAPIMKSFLELYDQVLASIEAVDE